MTESVAQQDRPKSAPRLWLVALAALAALAVASPWMFDAEPPVGVILLREPTLVGERQVRLSWRARAGAPRYLVEVKSIDEIPRFNGTSETTFIDLPYDVSAEILDGTRFIWSVTQVSESGGPEGKSAVEPLVLPGR